MFLPITFRRKILLFFTIIILAVGCKSAEKALTNNDYPQAVLLAAKQLKKDANHATSATILQTAYPKAIAYYLDRISKLKAATAVNWDAVTAEYKAINKMNTQLVICTPCQSVVSIQNFDSQEEQARQTGYEVKYQEALQLLQVTSREQARKAYEILEKLPVDYKDVNQVKEDAFAQAAFNVVVEQVQVTSLNYQLSNTYFQEQIYKFLKTNKRVNKFVVFHTPEEAEQLRLRPDHIVTLQFKDFVVGQTLLEKNTETVTSKDSVVIGETKLQNKKVPVYNKVTAKLTTNKRTVLSHGLLNLRVYTPGQSRPMHEKDFTGQYTWFIEWATFTGDERALTPAQLALTKQKDKLPPPPNQLFTEFSKPLYDQVTSHLKNYYSTY